MEEKHHDFDSLVSIMKLLRSENGCPWDMEQTHESIRGNLIEETYEAVEAIDTNDAELLREELGDVLLQVVFHARISEESEDFTINDVIHDVCAKLIHRHPHIFGNVKADTADEVLVNWENIKKEEKKRNGLSGSMDSVPKMLPALMRAQKLVKKAAKENAAPSAEEAMEQILASARMLQNAVCKNNEEELRRAMEINLTAVSAAAALYGIDAESILHRKSGRIIETFAQAERENDLSSLSPEERNKLGFDAFFGE